MWPKTFADRLQSWSDLRHQCALLPLEDALLHINKWWFNSPWTPYHLHWDDKTSWPDPWQLLEDNIYCSLARGLGILYTITLIDRSDCQGTTLVESQSDNLVLIASTKYILNWDATDIVNISHDTLKCRHRVSQQEIKLRIK